MCCRDCYDFRSKLSDIYTPLPWVIESIAYSDTEVYRLLDDKIGDFVLDVISAISKFFTSLVSLSRCDGYQSVFSLPQCSQKGSSEWRMSLHFSHWL